MITVVVGKEIEKIKGDFESYLNGLNMVGEISYSQYSELYDEGTKQMQRAYELGKSELETENAELKDKLKNLSKVAEVRLANWQKYEEENKELKELVEKYRQAVDKCLHITFMGGGCEVNTIGQYATLVDGYLTDVEGLAKWKN